MPRLPLTLVLCSLVFAFSACQASSPPPPAAQVNSLAAATLPPPATLATSPTAQPTPSMPTVPAEFRVTLVSAQPKIGTAITYAKHYFYVAELRSGNILRLADTDNDALLDQATVVASGFNMPRSLAFQPNTNNLYVSSRGQVNELRDTDGDGMADENHVVVQGLFDLDYMHSNNGIAFGPAGKLYIADGAPRLLRLQKKGASAMTQYAGTILAANPDGSDLQVYAHGFRNPFGLAFAADGSLYADDNGEDSIQAPFQGDELNKIVGGGDYGYPDVLGAPPAGSPTIAPLVNFPADSAPAAVLSYDANQFPATYHGSIFVALWNVGHKIVRAWRDAAGKWQSEDFMTDLKFPVGLTVGSDGSLYVLDMSDGVDGSLGGGSRIYRVTYAP